VDKYRPLSEESETPSNIVVFKLTGYGPSTSLTEKTITMDGNLTLDAIRHIKRFDGTLFQNWKHSMEIMFEFKDIKEIVEVRPTTN
jgi:DNA integrity scanning protein DisA with diadenylate cyclase activity